MTVKIFIKAYLREYVIGKFCNGVEQPVRFSEKFNVYHTIWNLMEKQPKKSILEVGNLEIVLPNRREGKNPRDYSYLSAKSQKIIEKQIKNIFLFEFVDFVTTQKMQSDIPYLDSIWEFLKKYDITSISTETLWKNYYRWKNEVLDKKGKKSKKISTTN